MAAQSAKKLGLNPEMLEWARTWRGVPLEEAAKAVGQSVERYRRWETERGDGPTVNQARKLAELYDRSILEFFGSAKPYIPEPALIPDFRLVRSEANPLEERDLKIIQMWAESKRASALSLAADLEEDIPEVPPALFSSLGEKEEEAAARARELVGLRPSDQIGLPSNKKYTLPDILRRKLEQIGILTIRRSGLRKFGMRGMCIVTFPLPIILFGRESPGAQVFTLTHELGHIALKESAISGQSDKRRAP